MWKGTSSNKSGSILLKEISILDSAEMGCYCIVHPPINTRPTICINKQYQTWSVLT
jgi:hypothetical protein